MTRTNLKYMEKRTRRVLNALIEKAREFGYNIDSRTIDLAFDYKAREKKYEIMIHIPLHHDNPQHGRDPL